MNKLWERSDVWCGGGTGGVMVGLLSGGMLRPGVVRFAHDGRLWSGVVRFAHDGRLWPMVGFGRW